MNQNNMHYSIVVTADVKGIAINSRRSNTIVFAKPLSAQTFKLALDSLHRCAKLL